MEYREFKERQQKEFNKFPLGCAFTNEDFEKMKKELPLVNNKDKYLHIGGGVFIRKSDKKEFDKLNSKLKKEKKQFIKNNFYDAVLYELRNHVFYF